MLLSRGRAGLIGALLGAVVLWGSGAWASTYTVLYAFRGQARGGRPAGVIMDASGNLYGQTALGGADCPANFTHRGCGIIFKLEPTGVFRVLATFDGPNGANGQDPLFDGIGDPSELVLRQQTLYGATPYGGTANKGVVFSVKTDGSDFQILHQFTGLDGAIPTGRIDLDQDRNIFGATAQGGPDNVNGYPGRGVLFKVSSAGSFTILHSFATGANGYSPSGVIVDQTGAVFGSMQSGYSGGIYSYVPSTNIFSILVDLSSSGVPSLIGLDRSGDLFSSDVGYSQLGLLFELVKSGSGYSYNVLHSFAGRPSSAAPAGEGYYPSGAILQSDGSILGFTLYGPYPRKFTAPSGNGSVYSFATGVNSLIYAFSDDTTTIGTNPAGNPAQGVDGTVYGTTEFGGGPCGLQGEERFGCGVIFKLTP